MVKTLHPPEDAGRDAPDDETRVQGARHRQGWLRSTLKRALGSVLGLAWVAALSAAARLTGGSAPRRPSARSWPVDGLSRPAPSKPFG
jgi:hypothetical protein